MNVLIAVTVGLLVITALPYVCYLLLYVYLSPSGSPAEKVYKTPETSIVLPTYNEEKIIESKLDDIVALNYPREKIDVVVVDSSDDDTREIVRDYFKDINTPSLTLIKEDDRGGVARAVNRAMKSVSTEIVFRTDCDSKLDSNALREAVANLADDRVGAVTGRQTGILGKSAVEKDYREITARNQILESHIDSTFICHGPCFAFERSAFVPIASDSLADDTEIGVNVRRSGKRVVMDPALRFLESGVSNFSARRLRKDRRAMGLIQLLVRNRDAIGKYGRYGRLVLPFNWWFMVISPWLITLSSIVATAAIINLIGLSGLALPVLGLVLLWLGQRDQLGLIQPMYAVVDSQVSLLIAQYRLALSDVTGTWDVDRDSRRIFE